MKHTKLINLLVEHHNYGSYLEIGVRTPANNYDKINVKLKHGVDPAPKFPCTFQLTSDVFFTEIQPQKKQMYDLVFIDGLHIADQVLRDINNSLQWLSPNGTIVVHDCNPPTEAHQVEKYDGVSAWNGTVWKAIAELRMTRIDLEIFTVDTDWGLGVIRKGRQTLFPCVPLHNLDYGFLEANRKEILNLIDINEFYRRLPKS